VYAESSEHFLPFFRIFKPNITPSTFFKKGLIFSYFLYGWLVGLNFNPPPPLTDDDVDDLRKNVGW
jgi:hypothetical protein